MANRLPCTACDGEMTWRGTNVRWEGDYEVTRQQWECQLTGCQTSATVEWRTFIPVDVARMTPQ